MPATAPDKEESAESFRIPTPLYVATRASSALAPFLERLSRIESWANRTELSSVSLDRPVYITGCARAGTTITLEMLSRHPDVATHQYPDFVVPYLPIWWPKILPMLPVRGLEEPVERLHKDGIQVTRESPEGVEEMIWMRFFPGLHAPDEGPAFDRDSSHPAFERYYRKHIQKLLIARGRRRYVAKNNYLATRLAYLVRAFPDARVLLLVRNPVNHIASLVKQHRLFTGFAESDPRQLVMNRIVGHYEFGPDRMPAKLLDPSLVGEVSAAWRAGHEVRGWALQWAGLYGSLRDQLDADTTVRDACHLVRYEDLCDRPREVIPAMLEHAGLPLDVFGSILEEYAGKLSRPTYYRPSFNEDELAEIATHAGPTAARYGYGDLSGSAADP